MKVHEGSRDTHGRVVHATLCNTSKESLRHPEKQLPCSSSCQHRSHLRHYSKIRIQWMCMYHMGGNSPQKNTFARRHRLTSSLILRTAEFLGSSRRSFIRSLSSISNSAALSSYIRGSSQNDPTYTRSTFQRSSSKGERVDGAGMTSFLSNSIDPRKKGAISAVFLLEPNFV